MFVTEYFWSAVFIEEWSPWLFFKISEVKLYEIKSWFYNILSRNLLKIDNNVKQKSFTKCNKIDSKYSTRNTFKVELLFPSNASLLIISSEESLNRVSRKISETANYVWLLAQLDIQKLLST